MRILKLFVVICLFFGSAKLYAQTYTVTSIADSGPGTLREALTNAGQPNRTTVFTINFQLPGDGNDYANRTIRLRTALPNITSNTIIDGSSQASWQPLGVSGAKIIIEPEYSATTTINFSALSIGRNIGVENSTTGVGIYGLCIRNFATINNLQTVNMSQGSAITIDYRASDINIGAPGKGNVLIGNINGILIQNNYFYSVVPPLANINIKSNLIGVLYDGFTPSSNVTGINASLYDCSLDVGGDNAGEGNTIAANKVNLDIKRYNSTISRFNINIINNKIGVDHSGQKDFHELPLFLSSSSLEIAGIKVDANNTVLYIRNNIVGGNRTVGISIANAEFVLTGNFVGTDATGNVNLANGIGIKIETNGVGTIGGTTAERNTIANNTYGIETVSARPVKITRNSMYCNRTFGIGKASNIMQPFIQVLKQNSSYVSGKATPNSEVELFYTHNCNNLCEGKTYIATVQAGSDGRWEYNASLSQKVTATATVAGATTSPFATAELLPNEAKVNHVTCVANGSITIEEEREGYTFSWVKIESDGTRIPLGNTQSVSSLEVGTYEVTIDDGCKAFQHIFLINDQRLTKPTITPPSPTCGQTSFVFRAETLRGSGTIRYEWRNAAGTIVSTNNPATLPEGTYTVKAIDQSNCTRDSDPITINRRPSPIINTTAINIRPASCGIANGTITGITIDDATGVITYKWYGHDPATGNRLNTVVGTEADLVDMEGGLYTLVVSDEGNCSPVSRTFTIGINNIIVISSGTITPGTCGLNNGIIDNVTIANADRYEWIKASTNETIALGAYATGVSIRIADLAPGAYILKASNSTSVCSYTRTFTVPLQVPQVFAPSPTLVNTTCELNNGSISLNFNPFTFTYPAPTRFQWKDEMGNDYVGTLREIKDLPVGSYNLFLYDTNNCQTVLGPFTINATPKLVIQPNSGTATQDGCGLRRGSVTGLQITGGLGDYTYRWLNEADQVVQTTRDLTNVGDGTYRLEVKDRSACGIALSEPYTVVNVNFPLSTPIAKDIRVCYVSDITLPIVGPEEGTYQLFASLDHDQPILESTNGVFNFKVAKTGEYFIRRKLGVCISDFTRVHIEVTHDNLEIGNAITPNGDGFNDTWMLKGLPDFRGNNIKIYARSGQLIYEATGNYTKPFDGTFRGKELPAGVYFYVIDLRAECKPISGSITLLR